MDTDTMVKMYVTTDCLTRGIRLLTGEIVTLSDDTEYFVHAPSGGVATFHRIDINAHFDLEVAHMTVRMRKAIRITELEAEIRRINNHDEAHKITFV
jgi:hypothetical protein